MGTNRQSLQKPQKASFFFLAEPNRKLPSKSKQAHRPQSKDRLHVRAATRFRKDISKTDSRVGVCSARLPPKLQRQPAQLVCKSNTSKVQSSKPHTLLDGQPRRTHHRQSGFCKLESRTERSLQIFRCLSGFFSNITDEAKEKKVLKHLVDLPLPGKLTAKFSLLVGKHYVSGLLES